MEKQELIDWYNNHTNCNNCDDLINYMIDNKIIQNINKNIVDDFLLEKQNNTFIQENGFFFLKKNRVDFIKNHFNQQKKINKFKLDLKNKNNIKLIKLN